MPLPAVSSINVYDETLSTMRVRWQPVGGASGYIVLYQSINGTEPQLDKEVTRRTQGRGGSEKKRDGVKLTRRPSACRCPCEPT